MLSHFDRGITLTMTTCKRLKEFIITIDSFMKKCTDKHLISRVIISDDRSSDEDRKIMATKYPYFEFYYNDGGQVESLSFLFSNITTEYFFHLEDDRVLIRDIDLLQLSHNILLQAKVDSFISAYQIGSNTYNVQISSDHRWPYYVHEYVPDGRFWSDFTLGNKSWPGFYLAAGYHRTAAIQSLTYDDAQQHERTFAEKYYEAGFKVAFNCGPKIFDHIGENNSAYLITKNRR